MSTPLIKPVTATRSAAQRLEEQKSRFQALTERKNRLQVELETAARQFAEAQAEAQREFGTGDLDELRALYATSERENEERVAKFTADLDAIEKVLADTEAQLAS